MGGKRTHHQDPLLQASALIGIHSLVHIYLAAQRIILPVRSMQQRPAPLSQSKTSLVKVQDTQRVLLLRLRIDEGVVGVDIEPGLARGKAGIRAVRPLHRRPRRIPRGDMDAGQSALDGFPQIERVVGILCRHIEIFVDGTERNIRHSQFLSLIQERRPSLQNIARRQHRTRGFPVLNTPVAVHYARVVMVLQIQSEPRSALQPVLPLPECALEFAEPESVIHVLCHKAVCKNGVELDQHIQHTMAAAYIGEGCLNGGKRRLSDLHGTVLQRHISEFLQVLIEIRAVLVKGQTVDRRHEGPAVGQFRYFRNEIDNVLSETVHAQIQPKAHDVLDLFTDFGIVHVEIGLFFGKNVQIVLSSLLVILPGKAFELAVPVVGRKFGLPFEMRVTPDVVIAVRIVLALAALDKPRVLIGRVVDHQIEQDFEAEFVGAVQHLLKLLQSAVVRMDVLVIRNVIAVIRVGRRIDRTEPDSVHAERLDVLQFVVDTVQVADPIPVSVAEAPDPYLVKRHLSEIKLLFI